MEVDCAMVRVTITRTDFEAEGWWRFRECHEFATMDEAESYLLERGYEPDRVYRGDYANLREKLHAEVDRRL